MSIKNITILGGSGFVGSHVAARLANAGHTVNVLTRYREGSRHLLVVPQVSLTQVNVHKQKALGRAIAGADVVINLVGILNESRARKNRFQEVHVDLVEKALQACADNKVDKFIHISALKADAENAPSQYLRSKGAAENLIRRGNGSDLNWTILQPSVIFGEDDSFINKFAKLLKLPMLFFPLPRAVARFAPVYVDDVASAIVRCLDDQTTNGKTYQLCGPHVYSLKEILQAIANQIGSNRKIVGMPDTLARMQARIMDFVPGKPFSSDNFKSLTLHSICETDGFARLDIKPKSLDVIMPTYLGNALTTRQYDKHRITAGRH